MKDKTQDFKLHLNPKLILKSLKYFAKEATKMFNRTIERSAWKYSKPHHFPEYRKVEKMFR